MPSPETELPDTRERRRCPACASEKVKPANHILAIGGVTREELRCATCGTAFWLVW